MRCVIVLASLLAILAVGCDGHTSVTGRVVDPDKKPIPKAIVTLTESADNRRLDRSHDTTTDEEGRFEVRMTHAPIKTVLLLVVSKEGLVRHEEKLTGSARFEKEIVLQPEAK